MSRHSFVASRLVASLVVGALTLLASGCGGPGDTSSDGTTGMVDGSGRSTIQQYAPEERESVDDFGGTLLTGEAFDVTSLDGQVSVVNVWGSWCGPCRVEAPALREVAEEFADRGVVFLGLNVRDNDAAARAFERSLEIPYPSIRSDDSPEASLAFGGQLRTTAVPMTVVLDRQRRVAARVVGEVTAPTLRALVEDALAEEVSQ